MRQAEGTLLPPLLLLRAAELAHPPATTAVRLARSWVRGAWLGARQSARRLHGR